jgi:uncharacterized membrane protein (DUF106 family)
MWHINSALNNIFDLMFAPFKSLDPFWPLFIVSSLTGVLMLVIFRHTSNQKGIRETKDRIKAHLLEIWLFKDNPRIVLSAQKQLLFYNMKYMQHALRPMLFMLIPVAVILIQLDGWFGYEPLKIGDSAIISVKLSKDAKNLLSDISLESDGGLSIETSPLSIPEDSEIDWRVRAKAAGEHKIFLNVSGQKIMKEIIVAQDKLTRLSKVRVGSHFWDIFLNPGERPIDGNSPIQRIGINYRSRSIEIFGWRLYWLVLYLVLSIITGYALKGVFKTEI